MASREPAESFHPGVFIKEEMDARGWDAKDLAVKTGLTVCVIERLIAGALDVTPVIATVLAYAFGTSSLLWTRLQEIWNASKGEQA